MEIALSFMVFLLCLVVGVRYGGLGLAAVSGLGLVAYVFVFGYKPGVPPNDVMLTILAVVTCAAFLQTSGGLTVLLKCAEKILRNHPKYVTILAPITTWFLTVLCGTGHVCYTMFPIIYDVAIKENIRPERPMAVSSVAAQMGICGSPVSVAIVSLVSFLAMGGYEISIAKVLLISVPSTFLGVLMAAIWSMNRGEDLDRDKEFQALISDPEQKKYVYDFNESLLDKKLPWSNYAAVGIFVLGILLIALLGNIPDMLPHFSAGADNQLKPVSMTLVIQMVMLCIAALIMFFCHVDVKKVSESNVFKAGMVALVSVYGVSWTANTLFTQHMAMLKNMLTSVVGAAPWAYALIAFLTSKLVNSQAAAIAVVVPLALSSGIEPVVILSFISACYGYFFLPTYPSDLACIGFDRSGTTKIGKYILNHSFMIPGLIGVTVGCGVGYVIAHLIV